MRLIKSVSVALIVLLSCFVLGGCQQEKTPDFSGCKRIAELSTLKCTFHNVAEIRNAGTNYLFSAVNVGYKKAWFEYDGTVELGVDVSKVKVDGPDLNNVVTITLPKVQVIGEADADENTFSDIYLDTGLFQQITSEDQNEAYRLAQESMREAAENDSVLMGQARERAEQLLSRYVLNVGVGLGQSYEINIVDAVEDGE